MPTQSQPSYYPPANRTVQDFDPGSFRMPGVNKLLLHTTETSGWPAYGGANGNPTLTYNPWSHEWRQHIPILARATTLQNAGSFQTNRDSVVQVEIVAYCDQATANKYGHNVNDIDDLALQELGEFAAWLHTEYGLKLASSVDWKAYAASYGSGNGVRLSVSHFEAYRGILGHQHAPGNVHGDPGSLDVAKIVHYAKRAAGTSTPKPPTTQKPDRPGTVVPKGHFRVGAGPRKGHIYASPATVSVKWINDRRQRHCDGQDVMSRHIWFLQHWLNLAGYHYGPSTGFWDQKTQRVHNQFRRDVGYTGGDAKGKVGIDSLTKLRAKAHATKKISN